MIRSLFLALVIVCVWVPTAAIAQDDILGRFRLGMTVAEVRAAAPEQQWNEQTFGVDLIVLRAERAVRIGRRNFTPMLSFREGQLDVIQFSGGAEISQASQCDSAMLETVAALEGSIGALNSYRAPGEFGAVTRTQTTGAGSQVRFYDPNETTRVGFATQRGEHFAVLSAMAAPIPQLDLACMITFELQAQLTDFEPLPPPTPEELASAQEIDADWATTGGPRVTELTMPADAIAYVGNVRIRLDCLVVGDQRINCAVVSEEPMGMHFGDAALAASRFYRIERLIDGQPTLGKRVSLTVRYELGSPSR